MYCNLIFVGGIHGVGKSTLCRQVSEKIGINYLSASEVLKWEQIKNNHKDKNVENINFTQEKLISGLEESVKSSKKYILDGHFCLFNEIGDISRIPLEIFKKINPILVCVILDDPIEIAKKLYNRDGKIYNTDILAFMQAEERVYGNYVAKTLAIPYLELSNKENETFERTILNMQ